MRRSGKRFLYPPEIQLFARTYKWPDPETCLGGCDEREFQQDYTPSPLEKKSLLLVGLALVAALLGGKTSGKSSAAALPKMIGFDVIPGSDYSRHPAYSGMRLEPFRKGRKWALEDMITTVVCGLWFSYRRATSLLWHGLRDAGHAACSH